MGFDWLRQSYASDQRGILPAVPLRCEPLSTLQLMAADKAISKVVEKSSSNTPAEDETGKTALICLMLMIHLSSESHGDMFLQNREDLIAFCLSKGVDVNEYDKDDSTALHYLPRAREDEESTVCILRMLLKGGTDVHLRDRPARTAFHLALPVRSA